MAKTGNPPVLAAQLSLVLQTSTVTMYGNMQASWLQALEDKQPLKPCHICNRRVARVWTWLASMTTMDGLQPHTCSGWPCLALQVCFALQTLASGTTTRFSSYRLAFSACLDEKQSLSNCLIHTLANCGGGFPLPYSYAQHS